MARGDGEAVRERHGESAFQADAVRCRAAERAVAHEGRRDRRQRAHRQEARGCPPATGPRGGSRFPLLGRQRPHRRGARRGALVGANVVVDVSNSPSWADAAVMAFFDTSTRNVLAAEAAAGVGHHVALSVVGADRMPDSGYMRAKVNQEEVIAAGGVPYSIVRATQFFEFLGYIADSGAEGDAVRLSTAPMQPLAADDVAAALADVAVGAPLNATVELAGPEAMSIAAFVGRFMAASGDKRTVIADPQALYTGAVMGSRGIAPGASPRLGPTRFEDWVSRSVSPK